MKPCSEPGCPALTASGGYCAAHRNRRWRQHQDKTAARGYGAAHRRWGKAVLKRDPLCIDCLAEGRSTPVTDADHIDGDPFNRQLDNGRGLCRKCHNRRTHGSQTQGERPAQKTESPWGFE